MQNVCKKIGPLAAIAAVVAATSVYSYENDAYALRYGDITSITSRALDVEVVEQHAYVVLEVASTTTPIYDISNVDDVRLVGALPIRALRLRAIGTTLYATGIASGAATFAIFDIADPANPTLTGSVTLPTPRIYHLHVDGDFAYLAGQTPFPTPFSVIDLSNPTAPTIASTITLSGVPSDNVLSITSTASTVYVGRERQQLDVIDVSTPTAPTVATTMTGFWSSMDVDGTVLYAGGAFGFFDIYDVSTPHTPTFVRRHNLERTYDAVVDMVVVDGYAHLAVEEDGYQIVDVTDPMATVGVNTILLPDQHYDGDARALDIGPNGALVAGSTRLTTIPLDNINRPRVMSSTWAPYGHPRRVSAANQLVAATTAQGEVTVFGNPDALTAVTVVTTPGQALDIVMVPSKVYVADGTAGLQIIDLALPTAAVVAAIATSSDAVSIRHANGRVYVGTAVDDTDIIDVSTATAPRHLSTLTGVSATAGHGNLLYAIDGTDIRIVDVTDPTMPTTVGTFQQLNGRRPYDVVTRAGRAYVMFERQSPQPASIAIYGLGNPLVPVERSSIDIFLHSPIVVVGGFLYANQGFLIAFDVSDADNPIERGRFFHDVGDFDVGAGRLYISENGSVRTVDMGPEFATAGAPSCVCVRTSGTTPTSSILLLLGVVFVMRRVGRLATSSRRS